MITYKRKKIKKIGCSETWHGKLLCWVAGHTTQEALGLPAGPACMVLYASLCSDLGMIRQTLKDPGVETEHPWESPGLDRSVD